MVKKTVLLVIFAIISLYISGCQTFHGMAGDAQWTGDKVTEILEGDTSASPNTR
jgi:predicted small secreted protein